MKRLSFWVVLLVSSAMVLLFSNTFALAGRNYALIIGVSDYNDREGINSLGFVVNDVAQIAQTLENADFTLIPYCEKETGLKRAVSPTKENIEEGLREELSADRISPDDVVLVYFSGHGTRSLKDDQKTYLLVKDSVNGREETYLEAQGIRDLLADCPARQKILILDSCHAGGTRSAFSVDLDRFVEGGTDNVTTFASCTIDQVSKKWDDKSMSFFTYWLNEGLKGYADSDRDDTVSTEELFHYICENLELTEKAAPHGQWPVVVGTKGIESFTLASPNPRNLYQTLDDMAEQLVTQLMLQNINEIHFNDFTTTTVEKYLAPVSSGTLKSMSRYSSRELERRIRAKGRQVGIKIVSDSNSSAAVIDNHLTHHEENKDEMVYLISSSLSLPGQPETKSIIQAKVQADQTDETVQSPTRPSQNEDLVSEETSEASLPTIESAAAGSFVRPEMRIEVLDPSGQFLPRPIEEIDGALWTALDEGEVYRISIVQKNPSAQGIGMRLLVDGQNTIPQYMPYVESKFIITEAAPNLPDPNALESSGNEGDSSDSDQLNEGASGRRRNTADDMGGNPTAQPVAEEVISPHVRLDQARFWILPKTGLYQFNGFYHDLGADAAFDEFTVAKTAGRLEPGGYNDQIGLIVAGFYGLDRTRSPGTDVMTVPGRTRPYPLFTLDGFEIGELLDCIQIHYVSSAALEEYRNQGDVTVSPEIRSKGVFR